MIADVRAIDKLYNRGVAFAAAAVLSACSQAEDHPLNGYAEVDPIEISHSSGGVIEDLLVRDGDDVRQGQALIQLEAANGQSARRAAIARIAEARGELDFARAMPKGEARDARIAAALARVEQAQAQRDSVSRDVTGLTLATPRNGRVGRIYFQVGERLPPQAVAVTVIPVSSLFVRFFIPESRIAELAVGTTVQIECADCGSGLKGQVRWIASEPEFAPPMIQTRENQQRMTYRADIVLADPGKLHPGEPVIVVAAGGKR